MAVKPATLRKRSTTAAKRSLNLIITAAQRHLQQLEDGETPSDTFTASVARYEDALSALQVLDQLGEAVSDNGTVEVSVEALTALIELLRSSDVGYVIQGAEEGSPLDSIVAVVGTGEPAPEAS